LLLTEFFDTQSGLLAQVFLQVNLSLFRSARAVEEPHLPLSQLPSRNLRRGDRSVPAGRLGVAVGNWAHANAFDLEDQNLLAAVGEQAAIALNNARMINALEEREERLAVQNEILARQNRELELTRQHERQTCN